MRLHASWCAMFIAATTSLAALTTSSTRAAVVYDNTTTSTGVINDMLTPGNANGPERGNTVTLAGIDRIVQELQVRVRSAGPGVSTFDKRVRFYTNNSPGGAPGSLLWDSGSSATLIDSGADLTYTFAVPDVTVPSSFTWTIQLSNRQGIPATIGPVEYSPVTIGSAPNGYWQNDGAGNWQFTGTGSAPFGARISAVAPEPSTMLGVLVALTLPHRRRRCGR